MKQDLKKQRNNAAYTPSLRGRLLQCAAASVAAWVMASSPAHAAIPPECDIQVNPNIIDCVVAAPGMLGPIDTVQDDTTILIGDANTPTFLNAGADDGVVLTGNGAQTIVLAADSTINAEQGNGIVLSGDGLMSISAGLESFIAGGDFAGIVVVANGPNGAINLNLNGDVAGLTAGIDAQSNGAGDVVIIAANGEIRGFNSNGLQAINNAGSDLIVDTSQSSVIGSELGIAAGNAGTGVVSVTTGDVTGTNSHGIFIQTAGAVSDVLLDSTAGSILGGDNGINLGNFSADANVRIVTADVTGEGNFGIAATNVGSDLNIDSTAGLVFGEVTGIITANTGSGRLDVVTADVTGNTESGINAGNEGTSLFIDSRAGEVSGATNGIEALNNGTSSLVIATGNVSGADKIGIEAENNGLLLFIDSTAGTVTGGNEGIVARNNGGSLTLITADVNGLASAGLLAENSATATFLTVDTSAGSVIGDGSGIVTANEGDGGANITTGNVTSLNSVGVRATNSAAGTGLTIDTSAGSVNANFFGISATNDGSGDLSIASANISSENSDGILAMNNGGGDLFIDSSAGSITAFDEGVFALQNGAGALSITTANVTAQNGLGIRASNAAAATDLQIDSSLGIVDGATDGINAFNNGSGRLDIVTANVTGNTGRGIRANNEGTSLLIDSRAGDVAGATNGIEALNNGTSSLVIATGNVSGGDKIGIEAENNGLLLFIDSTAGTVSGGNEGIVARNSGGSLTLITADVNGLASAGLLAENSATATFLTVDTSAGSVIGGGSGILAANEGTGALSITTGNVTGLNGLGVRGTNSATGAGLTINTSAGSVNASSFGIIAENDGSGDLSVTSADINSATSDAIRATNNGSGDLFIDSSAGSIAAFNAGIDARQNGTGALSVTTGNIDAGTLGVRISTEGGSATVNNLGVLTAGDYAIFVMNTSLGETTINNDGTIVGAVRLGAMDDVLNNNNMVFTANSDSDFGTGEDAFFNNGQLQVLGNVKYDGLELLSNSGTISMANGNVGDSLSLTGQYLGSGGRLDLDVSFGAVGSSDQLIVDGSATGTTIIDVSSSGQIQSFGTSITLVDAGVGTDAGAFELEGGNDVSLGLLNVALTFDAVNNDFLLNSAIGTPVFQTLKFTEGAQSLWYRSADAWAMHVNSKRHTDADRKSPLWFQLYGATSDHDDSFDFASSGFTQEITLDYSQDYFGLQGGIEFGPGNAGEGVFYGLTTGYTSSNLGFDGTADRVRYDAFNFGAYVGYQKGGFFANGLAKYDVIDADVNAVSGGYTADLNGDAYGVRLESGYRWTSGNFFVEPSASLEYQKTSLDDFDALGANFDLESFDGLRGTAGVRLGGETKTGGDNTLTYYVGLKAVHEFEGDGSVTFSTPMSSIAITNNAVDTYGRIDLGLNIATKGGVTGFIEGNADVSGDYTGFGGRVGLRIAF